MQNEKEHNLLHNIIRGGSTSIFALTFTYPIDIWKINNQSRVSSKINLRNIYRGFGRTAMLTFPEKGVKLGVYKYVKDKEKNNDGFSPIAALSSSFFQSKISTPIDMIKISNLHQKKVPNLTSFYTGLRFIYLRDAFFNLMFFYNADNNTFSQNKPINNLLSGMLATSCVTPIDVIKTRYQESYLNNPSFNSKDFLKKFIKESKLKDYFRGILGRNMSIGIFYGISYSLFS